MIENNFFVFIRQVVKFCLFLFYVFFCRCSYAQDSFEGQIALDSLKKVYHSNENIENKLRILAVISHNETNPSEKLYYSDLLIKAVKDSDSDSTNYYLSAGYLQKANALQLQGEFHESLGHLL